MKRITDPRLCTGCTACVNVCPKQCINMVNVNLFSHPEIDEEICINCNLCEKVCPNNKKLDANDFKLQYKGVYSKDDEIIKNSSSGGVFSELATYVLGLNGIVYGCAFIEGKAKHIGITSIDDLPSLRGSKYVQSEMGNCFLQISNHLKSNKVVLFVGTGCQIAGLKSYLGKSNNDNLFLIEILCHGVASPVLLDEFLQPYKNKYGDIESLEFRNKELYGWTPPTLKISFKKKTIKKVFAFTSYGMGFGKGLFNREVCMNCKYTLESELGDLIIADFWGCENIKLNKNGTSLVIIKSIKGQKILDAIRDKVIMFDSNFEEASKQNPKLLGPNKKGALSEEERAFINTSEYSEICERYNLRISKIDELKFKILSIIRRN